MYNHPGTVSKILWHFTGGPLWDNEQKKQKNELKPESIAYKNLKLILESSTLKLGSYKEIVKVIIDKTIVKNEQTGIWEEKTNWPIEMTSSPICCVADIPIQHLEYHAQRYGKFAIGFYRDSLIKAGFNPVLYTFENASLIKSIARINRAIEKTQANEINEYFEQILRNSPAYDNIVEAKLELFNMENNISEIKEKYFDILAFIKTLNHKELNTIYCEREWRSIKEYRFSNKDVVMVVLPKKGSLKNYYNDFIKISTLPRKIPIICWEDMIEY